MKHHEHVVNKLGFELWHITMIWYVFITLSTASTSSWLFSSGTWSSIENSWHLELNTSNSSLPRSRVEELLMTPTLELLDIPAEADSYEARIHGLMLVKSQDHQELNLKQGWCIQGELPTSYGHQTYVKKKLHISVSVCIYIYYIHVYTHTHLYIYILYILYCILYRDKPLDGLEFQSWVPPKLWPYCCGSEVQTQVEGSKMIGNGYGF